MWVEFKDDDDGCFGRTFETFRNQSYSLCGSKWPHSIFSVLIISFKNWFNNLLKSEYFHIWMKIHTWPWLNWRWAHSWYVSVTWNDTQVGELLAVSGCIPFCQPHRHRVKSLGWLVLVIRPVSHYTYTQGERFTSAQRRNLSILLSVDVRCPFNVYTIATESLQGYFMLLYMKFFH